LNIITEINQLIAKNLYNKIEKPSSDNRLLYIHDILKFLTVLNKIKYGYLDKNNKVYKLSELNSKEWNDNYQLQIKNRLLTTRIGHCWDFVELERWFFNSLNIKNETYFICDSDLKFTHTILLYFLNNKVYYIESAWFKNKGIYEFNSTQEFWAYFIPKYSKSNNINEFLEYHEYKEPNYPMTVDEFIGHCVGHSF